MFLMPFQGHPCGPCAHSYAQKRHIYHMSITYSNIRFETYFCFQSHLHVLDSKRIFHNKSLANKYLSNLMAIEKMTSYQHHVISLHIQIASCSHNKVSPQSLQLGTPDSSQPASGPERPTIKIKKGTKCVCCH